MTELAIIDASCEAHGHPTSCTEPAPGTVQSTSSHNITVTAGGSTKEIATIQSADMHFDTHAHQYSDIDDDGNSECHDMQSHDIDPDGEPSITINGSNVYMVRDTVTTDPGSGGDVDIVSNPVDTKINKV